MTRNIFVTHATRIAVTAFLAAIVQVPGVAGTSAHFFSFFSTPSTGTSGTSLGSNGVANPFGGAGRGWNLDFGGPHLNFGSGGSGSGNGLSGLKWHIGSRSTSGPLSTFASSLHDSSTFSLAIHSSSPSDVGLTSYQTALQNGTPTAWLSAFYQNNGASLSGKDRTNPGGGRSGCPPVPEANTSVTFGLMLLLGLIAWRYSTRSTVRRVVRI